MPVYSRKTLRQNLGRDYLRDTLVGVTTHSCGRAGSGYIMDSVKANVSFSGEALYERAWGKVNDFEYRISSFNAGSGAFLIPTPLQSAVYEATQYEIHELLAPSEKDRILDHVIQNVWDRQEIPIWGVQAQQFYSLGPEIRVFNAWYYGDPASSLDRERHDFSHWSVATTATGAELRISPTIQASEQLIIDAQVYATLGSADTATVNIPNEQWVLNGAAAWAYELLARRAPGQEAKGYREDAARFAKAWTAGLARHRPQIYSKIQLESPW